MTPERWRRVEELYHAALERQPAQRAVFLAEASSGDEGLRREVESLLAQESSRENVLDRPAWIGVAGLPGSTTALAPGTQLGPYRIEAALGAGGMGQVYKARDTRLGRVVAVKILAERFSDRFEREARAISALNHPHICTLHDVGSNYLVMELVEGETLAARVQKGPLPMALVLRYGAEIADALAAAHSKGIIHRDLKPGNIMLTKSGVKVLDFGLAKMPEQAGTPLTASHAILGTPAYMAPEQLEGQACDARTDIFALGLVLYEMTTGKRAQAAPGQAIAVNALTAQFAHIVERCLERDPENRWQSARDVQAVLDWAGKSQASAPAGQQRRRRAFPLLIGALAPVVLGAVAAVLWTTRQPAQRPAPVLSQLTSDTGFTIAPALSPDGKLLAYASDRGGEGNLDIWVRQVPGGEPIRLTQDPANDSEPSFSPDGTIIVFNSRRGGGGIYAVSALGGPARKIAPHGNQPRFSPDGSLIAYWTGAIGHGAGLHSKVCRIFVVAASGGVPRQMRSDFAGAAHPEWTPDGKHLLFLGNRDNKQASQDAIDWWITPLGYGPAIATGGLIETRKFGLTGPFTVYPWALITPVWHPDGNSLIFSARQGDSRNLWSIGISNSTWRVSGAPVRLTSGTAVEQSPSAAIVRRGSLRLAFASLAESSDIWSLALDANAARAAGEPRRLTSDTAVDFDPSLSPDGTRMVFVSGRSGGQDIWIRDLTSGAETALTATHTDKYCPNFSPDSRSVSFAAHEGLKWDIYVVPASGGAAEMLCENCGEATDWSPNGRYVVGNDVEGRLILTEVAAHRSVPILALPERWFASGKFSPDGRWITFLDGSRRQEFIAPFSTGAVPPESTWNPVTVVLDHWSPNGRLVYGSSGRDGFLCIWAQRLDPSTKRPIGDPIPIFHAHGRHALWGDLSVGRERVVFGLRERVGNIWMAEFRH